MDAIPIGAHLVSARRGYTHHGIYAGEGRVIHYAGLANGIESGPVEETVVESFCAGRGFKFKTYVDGFAGDEIVRRARSRLGEESYGVFHNNCEHFCLWCCLGDHRSPQVDKAMYVGTPGLGGAVGFGSRMLIASGGAAVGLSGAGVMSGLASAGGLVGGGAVAGIVVLGAAPAAALAAGLNHTALADSEALDATERVARKAGRRSSYAGVLAGTAGSVLTLSAAGTTAGLSAAGISSGLAAVGSVVGGGMAAGAFILTATPSVIALGAGYGVYKLVRWLKR